MSAEVDDNSEELMKRYCMLGVPHDSNNNDVVLLANLKCGMLHLEDCKSFQ